MTVTNEIGLIDFDTNRIDWVEAKTYPDGSPRVDFLDKDVSPAGVVLRPKSIFDLMTGLFLVDAMRWRGWKIPALVLPFVPAARQDRLNDSGDYLFTLKSVANEINARNFSAVIMVDPHSMVAPALIENSRVVNIVDILKTQTDFQADVKTWDGVIAPDSGATKRAFDVARYLGVPFYQGEKHRSVTDGKLSGFAVDVPGNAHYLVVDDICDGGGTFNGLASAVNHNDTTLDLWVTHGVFSQGTDKLLENFGQIITTDTTTFDKGGARVLPIIDRISR
jgi:ribose-phosphate pyrophosphokinase